MSKGLLKILITAVALTFITSLVYGVGTPYGTRITNTAIVTGANFTKTQAGIGTNVQRIVGGHWVGEADQSVSAGQVITNTTYLTNLGNAIFTFQIRVTNWQTNLGAAGAWPWIIYTNENYSTPYLTGSGDGTGYGGNYTIGSNTSKRIDFVVRVTNTATGGYSEWRLLARTSTPKQNTDNYQGDNGTWYGGPNGEGWGDTVTDGLICYGPDTDPAWTLSINAPNIQITKTIDSILIADPSGPNNVAVPGATITFRVRVTNSGSGAANRVIIRDQIPANTEFVTGSTQFVANPGGFKFAYSGGIVYCSNLNNNALPANQRVIFTFRVTIN